MHSKARRLCPTFRRVFGTFRFASPTTRLRALGGLSAFVAWGVHRLSDSLSSLPEAQGVGRSPRNTAIARAEIGRQRNGVLAEIAALQGRITTMVEPARA